MAPAAAAMTPGWGTEEAKPFDWKTAYDGAVASGRHYEKEWRQAERERDGLLLLIAIAVRASAIARAD